MTRPAGDDAKRLGRAVVFVHQHAAQIRSPQLRAEIEILLLTGRAMDFATRIKGHEQLVMLSHELVHEDAKYALLGGFEMTHTVLPKMSRHRPQPSSAAAVRSSQRGISRHQVATLGL